jgi:hypothetical protein
VGMLSIILAVLLLVRDEGVELLSDSEPEYSDDESVEPEIV